MTETHETVDLWGDIVTEPIRTPLTILKEQGALLERKTNGILTAKTRSVSTGDGSFRYQFIIASASLSYEFHVFTVIHPVEVYPLSIISNIWGDGKEAADEKQFLDLLKDLLQSPKTQKVINSLMSQSTGV